MKIKKMGRVKKRIKERDKATDKNTKKRIYKRRKWHTEGKMDR